MKQSVNLSMLARIWSWSAINSAWWIGSRLFLTPFVLQRISVDGYGVWSILFSIPATISVLDPSFGQAYVKVTAEQEARGDWEDLSRLLTAGVVLVAGVGAVGLTLIWLARGWILPFLRVAPAFEESAETGLLLISVCVLLQMSVGSMRNVLMGLQRSDLTYKTSIISSVINFGLSLVLLQRGFGIAGLAFSYLAGEVIAIGLCWLCCRRLAPGVRLSPRLLTRDSFRRIVRLAAGFQSLYLLAQWTTQGFRLLLSALMGPEYVAYFELGHRVLGLADLGAATIQAPMMAALAQLHSAQDARRVGVLHRMGTRLMFVVALLGFGFAAVFALPTLDVWTGQSFPLAAWTVRAVALAYVAKSLTGMCSSDVRARGAFGLEIRSTLLNVVLRVSLVAPLYWLLGYEGFVLAGTFSLVLASMWFFAKFYGSDEGGLGPVLSDIVWRPLLAVLPIVVLAWLLASAFPLPDAASEGRWRLGGLLLLWATGFSAAGLLSVWRFGLIEEERGALSRQVQRALLRGEVLSR